MQDSQGEQTQAEAGPKARTGVKARAKGSEPPKEQRRAMAEIVLGGEPLLFPPRGLPRGTRCGPIDGEMTRDDGRIVDPDLPPGKRARNPLVPGHAGHPARGTTAEIARTDRTRRILALARLGWSMPAIADREGCAVGTVHAILRERLAETSAALARETEDTRARMLSGLEQQERTLSLVADGFATGERAAPTYAEMIAAQRVLAHVRSQLAVLQGIRPAGDDSYTDWLASIAEADKRDGGADTVQGSAWQEPARIGRQRGADNT